MSKLKNVSLVQIKDNYIDKYQFVLTSEVLTAELRGRTFDYTLYKDSYNVEVEEICNLSETHQYIPTMTEHFKTYDFDNFGFRDIASEFLFYIIMIILSPILLGFYIYDKVRNQ